MIKAAVKTVKQVMSRAAGCELGIGVIAVIQTAGRASNYNPHLHLMVTGGGIDEQGKWREVKAISYDYLHREWQRQLFAMMEEQARSMEMAALLEALRKEERTHCQRLAGMSFGDCPHAYPGRYHRHSWRRGRR